MERTDAHADTRLAWRIVGRVQGVGFRWSTARKARELGVSGAVWNRGDGSVEVHARGERRTLETFEGWLGRGPSSARVTSIERVEPGPEADRSGFEILH